MNKPSSPKKFLFIGCGGIANAHARAIEEAPELYSVAMTCDANKDAAESFAKRFNAKAFTNVEDALQAAVGEVDGVVAAVPHFLHHEIARATLQAGLPILMEKPVVCEMEQLRDLQTLERPGVFAQAGQMQRFGEEENWLKSWLNDSGEFGDPRLFNLDIYQNIQGYVHDKPEHWILDKRTAGGGIIISVGVHIIDLLRYWFEQDYVEVSAVGRFDEPFKNGAESTVAATLKMSGGMIGTLNCSYTTARCPYSQRSLIFGSNGTLYQHMATPGGGYMGPFYIASDEGKPSYDWNSMYAGFKPVAERRGLSASRGGEDAFLDQIHAFARSIEQGSAVENSLKRNLNTIAVIETLGKALLSGKTETVPTE